jgi:heme-degrading monooxygenase HmoA
VIARVWRGWTKPHDAEAYADFLSGKLFPAVAARVSGFRGADVLRRQDGPYVEFLVMTYFESLDDVRRFAGDEVEVSVIEPEAERLLVRGDERVEHYEVRLSVRSPAASSSPRPR